MGTKQALNLSGVLVNASFDSDDRRSIFRVTSYFFFNFLIGTSYFLVESARMMCDDASSKKGFVA